LPGFLRHVRQAPPTVCGLLRCNNSKPVQNRPKPRSTPPGGQAPLFRHGPDTRPLQLKSRQARGDYCWCVLQEHRHCHLAPRQSPLSLESSGAVFRTVLRPTAWGSFCEQAPPRKLRCLPAALCPAQMLLNSWVQGAVDRSRGYFPSATRQRGTSKTKLGSSGEGRESTHAGKQAAALPVGSEAFCVLIVRTLAVGFGTILGCRHRQLKGAPSLCVGLASTALRGWQGCPE
jgi:hypothetical protein